MRLVGKLVGALAELAIQLVEAKSENGRGGTGRIRSVGVEVLSVRVSVGRK